MEIIFVRHGRAEEIPSAGSSDFNRQLTTLGKSEVESLAHFLGRLVPSVDLVLSSPLVRAVQTAEILRKQFSKAPHVQVDELHYDTLPDETLQMLARTINGEERILCVGHEPSLSSVISLSLAGSYGSFVRIDKATSACVAFPGNPRPGGGILTWMFPVSVAL